MNDSNQIKYSVAEQVVQFIQSEMPRYLSAFRQMVETNSLTTNFDGVRRVGEQTKALFATLGFVAIDVPVEHGQCSNHLVLERTGSAQLKIGLVSHLDTVYSEEEERQNDFYWREERGRIYGPGTYDIKGGTILAFIMLDALRIVHPELFEAVHWVVLLDAGEEVFAEDFPDVMRTWLAGENTKACFVFEGGNRIGGSETLVTSRKGRGVFRIEVRGRGAHAGAQFLNGSNAIVQVARLIDKIAGLTNLERGLTFNVGIVSGGTVINRVPHHARCDVDMRARYFADYEGGIAAILALKDDVSVRSVSDNFPCEITVTLVSANPPCEGDDGTLRLFEYWRATAETLGISLVQELRGGLTDWNRIATFVPSIDGLGPVGGNDHVSERTADLTKDQEYIEADSLQTRGVLHTLAMASFITDCLKAE